MRKGSAQTVDCRDATGLKCAAFDQSLWVGPWELRRDISRREGKTSYRVHNRLLLLIVVSLLLAPVKRAFATDPAGPSSELYKKIAELDQRLFDAFNTCDTATMRDLMERGWSSIRTTTTRHTRVTSWNRRFEIVVGRITYLSCAEN